MCCSVLCSINVCSVSLFFCARPFLVMHIRSKQIISATKFISPNDDNDDDNERRDIIKMFHKLLNVDPLARIYFGRLLVFFFRAVCGAVVFAYCCCCGKKKFITRLSLLCKVFCCLRFQIVGIFYFI